MSNYRFLGAGLLAGGLFAIFVGLNSSHSAADQITNSFTGHFTDHTTWFILGGIAAAVAGSSLFYFGSRSNKV